ncbi:replicative protein [Lactobacillus sp. UMNPBX8]|uniref:rolling circle replication-associated protein n=2 Tax=unclassified Lactobacillus TaxID=2620435 RepID=UPI000BEF043A|nr:replicative protein [Lactobacillus sp. UMNPBX8]PEG97932.1 replicative protein [Lactobacillus sp. UMNPBX8]
MRKSEESKIAQNTLVTGYKYGDSIELSTSVGKKPVMKKVSKEKMVNRQTGEVKDIQHVTSRADPKNYESLRQTFKRLKRLIGANFCGGESELWITLTYRDSPMTDSKRLYSDFSKFMRKLRRFTKQKLVYIVVIEPQASGSLHAHLLLKTPDKSKLVILNDVVAEKWGQGFTKTKRLSDSDNVSAYLMAYLTNVDLDNLEGDFTKTSDRPKKIVKGGRLALYDVGMQIYRRSRGIVEPEKVVDQKFKVQKYWNIKTDPDYYRKVEFKKGKDNFDVEIEYYSLKKAKIRELKELNSKK